MSVICRLFVAGDVIAQPRPRAVSIGGHARIVGARKHPVESWKSSVRHQAQLAMTGRAPVACPVRMEMLFLMRRPKSMPKKLAALVVPHTSKPDLDNVEKAVLDACSAIVFDDDSQVSTVWKRKRYVLPNEAPGVFVQAFVDDCSGEVPFWP